MSYSSQALYDGFQGDLTTLPELQLRCRLTNAQAAQLCFVSQETYRRWRTDRQPNPLAVRFLAVMAGYLPWAGWAQWEMQNGLLFPPGYTRNGFSAGDILAMHFIRQEVSVLRQRVDQLRAELAPYQATGRRVLRRVP